MNQLAVRWDTGSPGDDVEPALVRVGQRRNEQSRHTDLHRDPVAGGSVADHQGVGSWCAQQLEHQSKMA